MERLALFSASVPGWQGMYATGERCLLTLFFMLVRSAHLSPMLGPDSVAAMSNGPLRSAERTLPAWGNAAKAVP